MKHIIKLLLTSGEIKELKDVLHEFIDSYSGSGSSQKTCDALNKILEQL